MLQLATTGILILAAQTKFRGLSAARVDPGARRLVPAPVRAARRAAPFNSGIVALAVVWIVLVAVFGGSTDRLIGLYAIGVFTSFTLSQAGMVRHWFVAGGPDWGRSALINAVGAAATATVTLVISISKFDQGAWIIIVVVPALVSGMHFVRHEYHAEARRLDVEPAVVFGPPDRRRRVVVAVPAMTLGRIGGEGGRTMTDEVDVVHVAQDPEEGERFRARVRRQLFRVHVVLVESPYRSLVRPFVRYLEVSQAEDSDRVTIVLLPEHLPHQRRFAARLLRLALSA